MQVIILLIKIAIVHSLTCNEVLEMYPEKKLSLVQLESIPMKDVVQCLAHLGKEKLPAVEADFIWKSIIKYYEGIENIPDSVLMQLHWVTVAISPEDYSNMTLRDIDVIQNFGLNYNLNEEQLAAIAGRVRENFGEKEPEEFTYYDLTALRQILCAFNKSEVERIRPSVYREAAMLIGKLKHCSAESMKGFGRLAIQERAFGPPNKWTEADISIIGNVAKYIPKTAE